MKKFKILAGILGIVLGVAAIFAPACTVKSIESSAINENGELIITYTDGTTQNLGVVKGEDGKDGVDGKDGEDLIACQHEYGEWQSQIAATCTSVGYDTRTCSLCGDLDYQFNREKGHNYYGGDQVIVYSNEEGHWGTVSCRNCSETTFKLLSKHNYDLENAVDVISTCEERWVNATCTDCGYVSCLESYVKHPYDENGVCTECGYITHFIESEE